MCAIRRSATEVRVVVEKVGDEAVHLHVITQLGDLWLSSQSVEDFKIGLTADKQFSSHQFSAPACRVRGTNREITIDLGQASAAAVSTAKSHVQRFIDEQRQFDFVPRDRSMVLA
jgi:hypothetical protein